MILFDPDQPEAAGGFEQLAAVDPKAVLPTRQTLLKHLRASQAAVGLKGEVAVLLTTDDGIRGLNRRFRKKNKATDVLSFPADGDGMAGDLAISLETAARQAAEQGHALGVELRVLILHGLLHLKGMDHESDDGAMARREARLRTQLKLPLGLIERVEAHGHKQAARAKAPALKKSPAMPGLKPRPISDLSTSHLSTSDRPTSRKTRIGVLAIPPSPQKLGKDGALRAVAGLKKIVRKKAGLQKAAR